MEAALSIKQQLSQLVGDVGALSQLVQSETSNSSKRARLCEEQLSPLDRDDILDAVFSYVGFGD
jgi:hypothetical protein